MLNKTSYNFKHYYIRLGLFIQKHQWVLWIMFVFLLCLSPTECLAKSNGAGGMQLIRLLQKGSLWLGMGVAIWGVVEAQLDFPHWQGRIVKGVIGYIAIIILPLIFFEIRDALEADIWEQIKSKY